MAHNEIVTYAPPETVFAVLSDARRYAEFVVGSRRVRRFEPSWPEPGSAFHHTLGLEPFALRDKTVSLDAAPPWRLVLEARMRPLGVNLTTFELRPDGDQTRIVVEERPVRGPSSWVWNPALDRLLGLRNALMLRRLKRLAERRSTPGPRSTAPAP